MLAEKRFSPFNWKEVRSRETEGWRKEKVDGIPSTSLFFLTRWTPNKNPLLSHSFSLFKLPPPNPCPFSPSPSLLFSHSSSYFHWLSSIASHSSSYIINDDGDGGGDEGWFTHGFHFPWSPSFYCVLIWLCVSPSPPPSLPLSPIFIPQSHIPSWHFPTLILLRHSTWFLISSLLSLSLTHSHPL